MVFILGLLSPGNGGEFLIKSMEIEIRRHLHVNGIDVDIKGIHSIIFPSMLSSLLGIKSVTAGNRMFFCAIKPGYNYDDVIHNIEVWFESYKLMSHEMGW